jgi:hypothetical protein
MERLVEEDTLKVQDFVSAKVFPEIVKFDALLGGLGPDLAADLLEILAELYQAFVKGVDLELSPVQRFPEISTMDMKDRISFWGKALK